MKRGGSRSGGGFTFRRKKSTLRLYNKDSLPNYKDAGSSIFVGFPKPWRFLRLQLEATLQSLVAAGCRAVVGSAACGNETLLAATSRPRG